MFGPAIVDDGSIRPFRIKNGVTIHSRGYCAFLTLSTLIGLIEQNSFIKYAFLGQITFFRTHQHTLNIR